MLNPVEGLHFALYSFILRLQYQFFYLVAGTWVLYSGRLEV